MNFGMKGFFRFKQLYNSMSFMQYFRNKISKLIHLIGHHSFARINSKNFWSKSFEISTIPFFYCLIVGLIICFIDSGKVNEKLTLSIIEFLQPTGIHIALLTSMVLSGISCFIHNIAPNWLSSFFKWLTTSCAFLGFVFSASAFGVFLGLAIPAAIDGKSFMHLFAFILMSLYFLGAQWVFVGASEIINKSNLDDVQAHYKMIGGAIILSICPLYIMIKGFDNLI
tara:strand:- start:1717 stop:2391 length:675 start_codon:yes stop_codon:yes gene_type:complete